MTIGKEKASKLTADQLEDMTKQLVTENIEHLLFEDPQVTEKNSSSLERKIWLPRKPTPAEGSVNKRRLMTNIANRDKDFGQLNEEEILQVCLKKHKQYSLISKAAVRSLAMSDRGKSKGSENFSAPPEKNSQNPNSLQTKTPVAFRRYVNQAAANMRQLMPQSH